MSDNLTYRALKLKLLRSNSKSRRVVASLISVFLGFWIWTQSEKGASKSTLEYRSKKQGFSSISVMTFNLQNLFDTRHDAGKGDWAFLPKSEKRGAEFVDFCLRVRQPKWKKECFEQNWDERALSAKIPALAEVILAKNEPPFFLLLQEVENQAVLKRLQQRLGTNYYPGAYLIEGKDSRGIDVALLSRIPAKSPPILHPVAFMKNGRGWKKRGKLIHLRGILEVRFDFCEKSGAPKCRELVILVLHLPSAASPPSFRARVIERLNEISQEIPDSATVIAGGDFNIHPREEKKWRLIKTYLQDHWWISKDEKQHGSPGSYFDHWRRSWSQLDLILVRRGKETKSPFLRVEVGNENSRKPPHAFDPISLQGDSDHHPVRAWIR